jgi:hypothetical protein
MELLGDVVMSNLVSVSLETVLVSVQDRCTICAKHTIGSESFWTHLIVLVDVKAQVEARFYPFGDSANLDANGCIVYAECNIGSEIVLDIPDGTTR